VGGDGQPLLRLTFNWHENDRLLYQHLIPRMEAIMRAMGPETVEVEDELKDYNIHTYQSTHPTGGAIMGADPGNSVTNKYGQVWDTPNVFVTGAALFPQNPGANPTGTVAALTYLAGDAIRSQYCAAPAEIMG
jgi:gluconate 2-dehydrogenase alpha chain